MKRIVLAVTCCAFAASSMAATKSCEELKAEIEAKIQSRNVSSYTLEIVKNANAHDKNMIVGTCEGGSKQIIYQKNDK